MKEPPAELTRESLMPQTIIKGIKALLAEANSMVDTMSIDEAKEKAQDEGYVFVDLRDIRELQRSGMIPGAFSCPRGMLEFWIDPESPYHKPVFNQDKTYVFYCASAWRSALSARVAMEMGLSPVLHLEGGFTKWVEEGGPVVPRDS
jgi:rhodanese-related sulfurtransferase